MVPLDRTRSNVTECTVSFFCFVAFQLPWPNLHPSAAPLPSPNNNRHRFRCFQTTEFLPLDCAWYGLITEMMGKIHRSELQLALIDFCSRERNTPHKSLLYQLETHNHVFNDTIIDFFELWCNWGKITLNRL